jgi:hypothetical protein
MRFRLVPAGDVEYRPWAPSGWGLLLVAATGTGIALGIALSMFWPRGEVGSAEYQLWRWEASTLLDNAFARMGIGPDPDDGAGKEAVTRYFALTSELRAESARTQPDLDHIAAIERERANYENEVERLVERYITEAVDGSGLQRSLPLFNSVRFTWPPVDFELTRPPQLLVRSPRNVIRRDGDTLLKNDIGLAEVERLEAKTSDEDTVSIVVPIGGLAAYPAIVQSDRTYDSTLRTSAHEWVHHYLAFYPLGAQWGKGGAAHTLNETTADIAGNAIADLIEKRHPIELPAEADGRAPGRPAPTLDFDEEMHALRLEVDGLLAAGKMDEAEAKMEAKRLELNAAGYNIRKLNQAYFAFYGTYAESPQSSDPIGPKVRAVWDRTQDLGLFLAVMRDIRDVDDLDRALTQLGVDVDAITAAP